MISPVVLIVRDGWGFSESSEGNAVMAAHTPVTDRLRYTYPWTILSASGSDVGLPEGFQGSSEVGHLNMGAGRIVVQELTRINDLMTSGRFWESRTWRKLVDAWRSSGSALHLLGLLQDEGVHAHMDHLFRIILRAREEYPGGRMIIHPFLDGRDTPPRSCTGYLDRLSDVMKRAGGCSVGTVMGRYYAMDRSCSWELTDAAVECIANGAGRRAATALEAVERSYANDITPDGEPMSDEYIPPCCIGGYRGMNPGDVVLHTNFRQDRAIQLSRGFIGDDYPGKASLSPRPQYAGMTRYYDGFPDFVVQPLDSEGSMENILGRVISDAGMRQLRIAETQKFRHVTSFFNGKSTEPFQGEEQVMIESALDPSSYASHPEMEAMAVTRALSERLEDNRFSFVLVNFANGDMVGHTGDFHAAKRAIEVVDECVGLLLARLMPMNAKVLVTSDHGNAEQMIDRETGGVRTSHSLSPVDLIYVGADAGERKLRPKGVLADIAPTVLDLLGLPVPVEMTAESLFEHPYSP